MGQINWDETTPADTESVSLGDDRIRSLKTSLRIGLDTEHVWPSAGGDAGVHRLGSARVFYDVNSLVSSCGTDGRLMVTSDTSRLYHVGSAGTMFLGSAKVLSAFSEPVGGYTFAWREDFGVVAAIANTNTVTFTSSGYSGNPFVQLTPASQGPVLVANLVGNATPTAFSFQLFDISTTPGSPFVTSGTVYWTSIGTRLL